MDSRGGLIESAGGAAEGALGLLAQRSGTEFQHLARARKRTAEGIPGRIGAVADIALPDATTLCLMGSWGRREVVDGSDDDSNLTRRILLLLESLPLSNAGYHEHARDELLERYIDESVRDYRVPRFLLNDVVRYWRTICVDFAGKEQDRGDAGWGLRNAKLRTSRKLLFASGLLPVLLCGRLPRADMKPFLAQQLRATATDRVAYAFLAAGEVDVGARALGAYDRFLGLLSDPEIRASLKGLTRADARSSSLFRDARELGDRLQDSLVALLFETPLFGGAAREYAVF